MARTRVPLREDEELARSRKEKLELSTAEIGLTVRTTNCLEEKGIFTVGELLATTRSELLGISNFGEKTLEEVYLALERIGFSRNGIERKAVAQVNGPAGNEEAGASRGRTACGANNR
jgi:DNA-directed RNA polymerase subunit alpha